MAPEHQSELIILLQIRTAVMYYNNKKVPAIVDLKNNPSMWHKAKSVTVPQVGNTAFRGKRKWIPCFATDFSRRLSQLRFSVECVFQGETEIRFDLPLPIVATNLMLEFTDFYENVSASIETLQCPRCSASVQVRNVRRTLWAATRQRFMEFSWSSIVRSDAKFPCQTSTDNELSFCQLRIILRQQGPEGFVLMNCCFSGAGSCNSQKILFSEACEKRCVGSIVTQTAQHCSLSLKSASILTQLAYNQTTDGFFVIMLRSTCLILESPFQRCLTFAHLSPGLPTSFHQKKPDRVSKKPDSSFTAYTHDTWITKQKIDIKTRQKHRYNTIPLLGSIFFHHNYTVVHLFLINNIDHF